MTQIDEILNLLKQIHRIEKTKPSSRTLPGNCYFLDNDLICAKPRNDGDSRHPYSVDGLTLWAYSSGYISINESSFFFIPPTLEGREPRLAFFGGVKNKATNNFAFTSITGVLSKGNKHNSYCVFGERYVYYIKEYSGIVFVAKLCIDENKNILISTFAINNTSSDKELYLSTFMNPIMEHNASDSDESKWFKKCELTKDGCKFLGVEDVSRHIHLTNYAVVKRCCSSKNTYISSTSSRSEFAGGKNSSISCSPALKIGQLGICKPVTLFSETSAYSDVVRDVVKPQHFLQVDYKIRIEYQESNSKQFEKSTFDYGENDKVFAKLNQKLHNISNFQIEFGKLNDYKLNNELFNRFLKCVVRQIDYGANAKNSSLMLLGIRDVCQMVEASLMWDLESARRILIQTLNFVDPSGRCPRQYSIPNGEEDSLMDNREFIDQGQWIISTIHTYLAFSGDCNFLNDECTYCQLQGARSGKILSERDSVYMHLKRIMSYLISNIDECTGCLKTLYGDWNDAIDGLGTNTTKNTNKFGNGVSSMATFHLYKNLKEMEDIVEFHNGDKELINYYSQIAQRLLENANANCIQRQNNELRIVHGWGDNKSFYVGSFNDVDQKSRHSLTSNAFYVISNIYKSKPEIKKYILQAYDCLDSKYGLKTFDVYFDRDAKQVGRIVNLPKGTAENAATYIHSAIFGVKSLFVLKEGKRAFDQIFKLIPITHNLISTSPFVMPNSYIYNPDIGVDGESMSDWYTGSSNTLIKTFVFDLFGLKVSLNGVISVEPSNYFPSNNSTLQLTIRNKHLKIVYNNKHSQKRIIKVNGNIISSSFNINDFKDNIVINIVD